MNNIKKKYINNYKSIIKYLIIFVGLWVLNGAEIYNCSPFICAMLFALMWTGYNIFFISLEYLIIRLISDFSLMNLYQEITIIVVLIFCFLLHKKLGKPMNVWLVELYMTIAQVTKIYYMLSSQTPYTELIVYYLLLTISLMMFVLVLQVLILRGIYYKFTLNESIAGLYLLICLGVGLSAITFLDFSFIKMIIVIVSLFLSWVDKDRYGIFVALALSLGGLIINFDGQIVANCVVILLATNIFKYPNKYKACFSVILCDLCYIFYIYPFKIDSLMYAMPTFVGVVLVLCVSNKIIERMKEKFYVCENEISMRNIVNITRQNLHKRFNELANVFSEMKAIHINLIKQDLTHEQAVEMLTNEVMKTLCKDCLDKQKCFRGLGAEGKSIVAKLIDIALIKGKISLLDIPNSLAMRCNLVNLLIGRVNQIVSQYGQFLGMKKDINNVKYLLAEQLGAVSQIMLDLGDEIDKHIRFDSHKESQLIAELLTENIICSEILIYGENDGEYSANLVIKGENAYNPIIEKVVSNKFKTKMRVNKVSPIEVNDFYSVNLIKDNSFDMVFGLSHCTKTGSVVSGDSHSLIRLGDNKYLLALCDGMGSGETANKTSALTINLIENFYKAGFSNELIIASVNKLLAINNQENYSTLDLCLVDLNKEIADFIKIGAPFSCVKHESSVEKVEGGALPIGVLDNITPFVHKSSLNHKSVIIMATDGVTDAFGDYDNFVEYINGVVSTNPQVIAKSILEEASSRNNNLIKDDMTVLVARTFKKGE